MHIHSSEFRLGALALALSTQLACGGDDGKNDAKIELHPIVATGAPLTEAQEGVWTWIDFPDTTCQDGSPSGIGVIKNSASTKLMIYLEGGGACFDSNTCFISPGNTAPFKDGSSHKGGLFNRNQPNNPVKDWNVVYVPYCTGDVHGGSATNVTVPGVNGVHQFTGYTNIGKFLQRVVPTWPNATDILLTGISAGGYGAAQNAVQVTNAFPNAKLKLIDDSGPGFSTAVMPECLQIKWRDLWGFENTFLKDCGDACPDHDNFVKDYAIAVARSFPNHTGGLIESLQDAVISKFIAAGNNNCTGTALLDQVPLDIYAQDLLDFRTSVKDYPNFGTYLPTSSQHTWLSMDGMYTASSGGVALVDWVTKIVNDQPPGNAGP